MGWKTIDENDETGTRTYMIDTSEDLTTESFMKGTVGRVGSFAIDVSTAEVYALNTKNEWVKL